MSTGILLISGSLRRTSLNTAVLRTAATIARAPLLATLYDGLAALPPFNPDEDGEDLPPPVPVIELRRRLADADALLFSTPEYAGELPGTLKNLLDWSVGGGELYGKPAGWINATSRPEEEAARGAYESLRTVLGYAGAEIVEPACRRIRVPRAALGEDGLISAEGIREQITDVLETLAVRAADRRDEQAGAGDEQALRESDRAFFGALLGPDTDALESMLADDFLIVDVSSGGLHSRDALLAAIRDGQVSFVAIEQHDGETVVRRHGDSGLVIGRTSMMLADHEGNRSRVESRYTHVFELIGRRWRLVSAQGTPVIA